MSVVDKIQRSPFGAMAGGLKCIAAAVVAFTLAVTMLLIGVASATDDAYAAIYPVNEAAQAESPDDASAAEGTLIADDENPLSSGLDDAVAAPGAGVPLYALAAIGIVAVAVFFLISTRKLNLSISKMNQIMR